MVKPFVGVQLQCNRGDFESDFKSARYDNFDAVSHVLKNTMNKEYCNIFCLGMQGVLKLFLCDCLMLEILS